MIGAALDPTARRTGAKPRSTLPYLTGWLIIGVIGSVLAMLHRTHGAFVYPLDDPYIHLSVARDLAQHGTWGISPGHYESASSSPLWTVVLAAAALVTFGHGLVVLPVVLATASSIWALHSLCRLLERFPVAGGARRVGIALGLVVATALVPLSVLGMEHSLHAALLLAALLSFLPILRGDAIRRDRVKLAVLLGLATLCRYETLFVAAGMAVAVTVVAPDPAGGGSPFARIREHRNDLALIMGPPLAAVVAYGAVNVAMGQGLLPNSVLAKSTGDTGVSQRLSTLSGASGQMAHVFGSPTMLAVLLGSAVVLAVSWKRHDRWAGLAAVVLVTALLQAALGIVDDVNIYWFRYQAYLATLAVACMVGWLGVVRRRVRTVPLGIVSLALALLVITSLHQILLLPSESAEVHSQQQQVATFLGRYESTTPVALNDLGFISFRHPYGVVDLEGLGTYQVLQQIRAGSLTTAKIDQITREHGVRVAALYRDWFPQGLPSRWVPVEDWCLTASKLVVDGDRCVTFYATDPSAAPALADHLRLFDPGLPAGVVVRRRSGG